MPVLFDVQFNPDRVLHEGDTWIFQYGGLEGRENDPLMARQALVRAVHKHLTPVSESMVKLVWPIEQRTAQGTMVPLPIVANYDVLPVGRADGEAAILHIDYVLLHRGDTWICAGTNDFTAQAEDPQEAKRALIEKVHRAAQQLIDQEGVASLAARPSRAGATGARAIGPDEKQITGRMITIAEADLVNQGSQCGGLSVTRRAGDNDNPLRRFGKLMKRLLGAKN